MTVRISYFAVKPYTERRNLDLLIPLCIPIRRDEYFYRIAVPYVLVIISNILILYIEVKANTIFPEYISETATIMLLSRFIFAQIICFVFA